MVEWGLGLGSRHTFSISLRIHHASSSKIHSPLPWESFAFSIIANCLLKSGEKWWFHPKRSNCLFQKSTKNVHFKDSDSGAATACGGLSLWRGLDVDVDVDIDRPIRSFGVSEFLIWQLLPAPRRLRSQVKLYVFRYFDIYMHTRVLCLKLFLIKLWYDGRTDVMEERRICQTEFVKSCQPVTVTDCMQVSELRCEVIWLRFTFIHVIIHSWFFSRTARWTQPWRRRRSRWWTSRRRSWRTAPRAWPQSCTPRRFKLTWCIKTKPDVEGLRLRECDEAALHHLVDNQWRRWEGVGRHRQWLQRGGNW